ncbi:phosphatase PAP2 family protein [Natrarchaeobius chitinivorans]|uniref:Phosphatase PAP2 family protein n=1 Tax=Natrarchaeobius chitinivorans TaxID=1679083 RepID=A0A3N6MBI8_NATCH|nr:phosphatase PAP2 family protein [Natrarchaeobius chitinivorans]RQG93820.1 phosphatase PAP2 family protein [Natrarchaeobius chitinivorans]
MNRDVGVTELIRSILPEWIVPVFETTALLGDELVAVGVLGVVVAVEVTRSMHRDSDRALSSETAMLLGIVLGGLALTLALKTAFGFSRPPSSLQAVPRESGGFPSGHTMAATVLWLSLVRWSDRGTTRLRLLVAVGVIGLVGFSRLALGVHYLVDVLASVGFGVGYLLLAEHLVGEEPIRAFGLATVLGTGALLVTGGTTDGWLAFVGCVGGAAGWWAINRPIAREIWLTATR